VQSVSNTSSFGRDAERNGEAVLGDRRQGEASMARLQEQEEDDCRSMAQRQQCVAREEGPGPRQQSAAGDGEAMLGERRHKDLSDIVELVPSSMARPRWRGWARWRRHFVGFGRKGRGRRGGEGPTCRHRAVVGRWLRYGSFD
jgi:hypothetical protein